MFAYCDDSFFQTRHLGSIYTGLKTKIWQHWLCGPVARLQNWALFDDISGAESLAEIGGDAQHELQVHKIFRDYTCRCWNFVAMAYAETNRIYHELTHKIKHSFSQINGPVSYYRRHFPQCAFAKEEPGWFLYRDQVYTRYKYDVIYLNDITKTFCCDAENKFAGSINI